LAPDEEIYACRGEIVEYQRLGKKTMGSIKRKPAKEKCVKTLILAGMILRRNFSTRKKGRGRDRDEKEPPKKPKFGREQRRTVGNV